MLHALALRSHFLDEVEADRAFRRLDELAEMHIVARLVRGAADLEPEFGGRRRIELELLARPRGDDGDRRRRREAPVLGLAAEVHVDGDVTTPMMMDMMMGMHAEAIERLVRIDRRVLIGTILD